jgi:hypothetical protein
MADRPCYVQMMGGLGNQMFQIAAGYAHTRRAGRHLILSERTNCKRPTYWNSFLYRCAGFVGVAPVTAGSSLWREPHFHYRAIPETATGLFGYFQSSRYFADCSGEIRSLFDPHPDIKAAVAARYADLLGTAAADTCVVHVRRTDYLAAAAFHVVCDKAWYARALAEMDRLRPGPLKYLVFSDDLGWCQAPEQADLWVGRDVVFVDEPTDCLALHLMSQFRSFVIPNSSFSWWAAWLSSATEDKTVIVPDRWFGPAGPQDWEDIYEAGWIRLP